MSDFIGICGLSVAMFVGCLLFGWIPMAFNLSQKTLQLVTIFGAGLLVGTSLVVIIPEGVETMYGHHNHHHEKSLVEKGIVQTNLKTDNKIDEITMHVDDKIQKETGESSHKAVGISLLIGFVFMLLIDQLGGSDHSHASSEIRLDELNVSKVGSPKSKTQTATIGLVVHAAADGIALGAAASTDRNDLQFIVFLAIMLHKAPAAFGLSTFLIHEGLEPRRAKKHILAFALAAPLLAIITYIFLNQSNKEYMAEVNATGIAMLFSAGTFLYVATVHVLSDIVHGNHGKLSRREVVVLVLGCVFPLLLNMGHHH